jgi:hypothetical protein
MKVAVIILGALIALCGGACMTGGAVLGVAVGGDGWIESDEGQLDTETRALVSEVAEIADGDDDAADFFDEVDFRLRIRVDAGDEDVFLGVGPAGIVTAYLAGVEHDVVDDVEFDPLEVETTTIPGTVEPEPPGDQPFWVQQVSGSGRQVLDWDIEAGSYRFVLMNADASPGVDTEGKLAVKIPFVKGIVIGLLASGAIALAIGLSMIIVAARSGGGSPPAPAQPTPTAPGSGIGGG